MWKLLSLQLLSFMRALETDICLYSILMFVFVKSLLHCVFLRFLLQPNTEIQLNLDKKIKASDEKIKSIEVFQHISVLYLLLRIIAII